VFYDITVCWKEKGFLTHQAIFATYQILKMICLEYASKETIGTKPQSTRISLEMWKLNKPHHAIFHEENKYVKYKIFHLLGKETRSTCAKYR